MSMTGIDGPTGPSGPTGPALTEEDVIRGLNPAPAPAGLSPDQRLIWHQFEKAKVTALRKNFDYGSSVFESPVMDPSMGALSAIEVRMSDKIKRLRHLKQHGATVNESVRDTMGDLGVYCFLWLVCEEKSRQSVAFGVSAVAAVPQQSVGQPQLGPERKEV